MDLTDSDCFQGNGSGYRGVSNRAVGGELCKQWPHNETLDHSTLGPKNHCRNLATVPGIHGPWCYIGEDVPTACDIPPCGTYRTTVDLPSGQHILDGTDICMLAKTNDIGMSVNITTRYDFGLTKPSCIGTPNVVNIPNIRGASSSVHHMSHVPWRDMIWFRYVVVFVCNMQLMMLVVAVVHCRRKIRKHHIKQRRDQEQKKELQKTMSSASLTALNARRMGLTVV